MLQPNACQFLNPAFVALLRLGLNSKRGANCFLQGVSGGPCILLEFLAHPVKSASNFTELAARSAKDDSSFLKWPACRLGVIRVPGLAPLRYCQGCSLNY